MSASIWPRLTRAPFILNPKKMYFLVLKNMKKYVPIGNDLYTSIVQSINQFEIRGTKL
jgi:hypothetical protein